jgi:hypothetical protein
MTGGADAPVTPTYGRYGVPETTFTIPKAEGNPPAISISDIQAKFPEVDWSKLDRLYIPAGVYRCHLRPMTYASPRALRTPARACGGPRRPLERSTARVTGSRSP